jgi:enediyne biosynthesis protein E4
MFGVRVNCFGLLFRAAAQADHKMVRATMLGLGTVVLALCAGGAIFDVNTPTGLDFKHENSPTKQKYLIETMGGGVALLDYNNDGLIDIFLVNSGRLTDPMQRPERFDREEPRFWNRLYRQNRDGSFTDVTKAAGLADAGEGNYGMGVAAADYDNDGYTDLYVTNYGRNILYHNNGNGTFTDVTARAGVAAGGWSVSAGFFDYDNDGKLDLFVTRYMEWDTKHSKVCERETYCRPGVFPATTSVLYRNRGNGIFQDVSENSGIAAKRGRALGVAFNDYDGDGFADIFVANDGMEQFLFHNNRNGTFTERAMEAGVSLSDNGQPFAGMGVDFRDYDNDGRPDIIVTNLAKQIYAVYHNDGNGSFSYRSLETGLGVLSSGSSGWGMRLADFDNDGWKDLFVAQSHVMDNVERIDSSLRYLEPPLLALNHHGRFERADSGMSTPVAGRGAAFGDLNNDGWMDVVMTVLGGRPVVFRNHGGGAHWLALKLQGTRSNRDGFAARVEVNGQWQYVNSGGSYLSASDKRVFFGLGVTDKATVEIWWPSGIHQKVTDVHADQLLEVREEERR